MILYLRGDEMALRQVRIDGDPLLRKKSREVKEVNDHIRELIDDLFDTMYEEEGVGIAAPQVGVLRRIFVVDDREGNKLALINPQLETSGEEQEAMEACLSVPNMQGVVTRKAKVKVSYLDENGEEQSLETDTFLARIIQHENDHLDGVLYTDRASKVYTMEEIEAMEKEQEKQREERGENS